MKMFKQIIRQLRQAISNDKETIFAVKMQNDTILYLSTQSKIILSADNGQLTIVRPEQPNVNVSVDKYGNVKQLYAPTFLTNQIKQVITTLNQQQITTLNQLLQNTSFYTTYNDDGTIRNIGFIQFNLGDFITNNDIKKGQIIQLNKNEQIATIKDNKGNAIQLTFQQLITKQTKNTEKFEFYIRNSIYHLKGNNIQPTILHKIEKIIDKFIPSTPSLS